MGSGVRFGDAESADEIGAAQSGDVFFLQLLAAIGVDGKGAAQDLHVHLHPQRAAHAGDLFGDDHGGHPSHVFAAVFLGNHRAPEAQLAHGLDGFFIGEVMLFIPLIHVGRDFFVGEFAHGFSQHVLFFG